MAVERPLVAAIDVGSATVHLLVAELLPNGALRMRAEESARTLLGARRTSEGDIPVDAETEALAALARYRQVAMDLRVDQILVAATEAVRAAPNGRFVADRWSRALDLPIAILTADQETRLALTGAFRGTLPAAGLFADSGGASTQVAALTNGTILWQRSLAIGAAGIAPAGPLDAPPTLEQRAQLVAVAQAAVATLPTPPVVERFPVVTGGSARILAAVPLGNHPVGMLTSAYLDDAEGRLTRASPVSLAQTFGLPIERACVLLAGCVILRHLALWADQPAWQVSEEGLREGMVRAWSADRDQWLPAAGGAAARR